MRDPIKAVHVLRIHSLHDADLSCTCGKWQYVSTGKISRNKAHEIFNEHLAARLKMKFRSNHTQRINIFVQGGSIYDVQGIPEGTQVVIYDYDIEGFDADRLSKDEKGKECAVTTFHADGGIQAGLVL